MSANSAVTKSRCEWNVMVLSASLCLLIIGHHCVRNAHLLIHVMRMEDKAQQACFLMPAYLPVTY